MQVKFLMAANLPPPPVLSPTQAWPRPKMQNIKILREKNASGNLCLSWNNLRRKLHTHQKCFPNMLLLPKSLKVLSSNHPGFFPSQAPMPLPSGSADLAHLWPRTHSEQWQSWGPIPQPLPPEPEGEEGFKVNKCWIQGHCNLLFPGKCFQHIQNPFL